MFGEVEGNFWRKGMCRVLGALAVTSAVPYLAAQSESRYTTPYSFTTYAGATSYGSSDGGNGAARFYHPSGVAVDTAGNVYVADEQNHTIRKIDASGRVSTWAGVPGKAGYVDGPIAEARFFSPEGLAVDAAGNVYVADSGNRAVRKITPGNTVSTVVREPPGSVDAPSGPHMDLFGTPTCVGVDAAGNVYALTSGNFGSTGGFSSARVVRVSPGGVTTVLYQTAVSGGVDNPGEMRSSPAGLVATASGEVFVTDMGLFCVMKISAPGVVSIVAGRSGISGVVDGSGSAATFASPSTIAMDAGGNLYVGDRSNGRNLPPGFPDPGDRGNALIRRISPDGTVTTLAGRPGISGYQDGPGATALFADVRGISVDRNGNIYAAEWANNVVRKITAGGEVSTLAGLSFPSALGSADGARELARFFSPQGMAFNAAGDLFVADAEGHTIRKINASGQTSTLAGSPLLPGSDDGVGSAARFKFPMDVAGDGAGNVYVADAGNRTIRKVTPSGVVTTVAGLASAGSPGFYESGDGRGSAARFQYPVGLAVDGGGNIYVADFSQNTIRRIDVAGNVTTVAGSAGFSGTADGTGAAARFDGPAAVALNAQGDLFVADYRAGTIRKVTRAGEVSTFAGSARTGGGRDGLGVAAQFNQPSALRFDFHGDLFVADSYNKLVRKITPSAEVSTIGGLIYAEGSTDGAGAAARFFSPSGIAVDSLGNVFVSSLTAIRKGVLAVTPTITTQPQSQTAVSGTNVVFSVVASGAADLRYQWQFNGSPISGATGNSLSLAGVRSADAGEYTVVVSTATDSVTSAKATLTVTSAPTPSPTGGGGSGGGGGGGAVSSWCMLALGALAALRSLIRASSIKPS